MEQKPYLFSTDLEVKSGDPRIQYQSTYQIQPPIDTWPTTYSSSNNSAAVNSYNSAPSSLQCVDTSALVTPISTAMYGTTATFSWAHTVPSLMPWVPSAETTIPDTSSVVRFSAPIHPDPCTSQTATSWELLHNLGASKPNPNIHLKRKGDLEALEAVPQKLCITEERMAARFQEMHISNQYSIPTESQSSNICASFATKNKPITNLQQLEFMLQDTNSSDLSSKSLILAPEVKKLVEPEKILSTFLNKIERPSMALMVWQPPNNRVVKEDVEKKQEEKMPQSLMEDNNNIMSQQLNAICQQYSSSLNRGHQPQSLPEDSMEI